MLLRILALIKKNRSQDSPDKNPRIPIASALFILLLSLGATDTHAKTGGWGSGGGSGVASQASSGEVQVETMSLFKARSKKQLPPAEVPPHPGQVDRTLDARAKQAAQEILAQIKSANPVLAEALTHAFLSFHLCLDLLQDEFEKNPSRGLQLDLIRDFGSAPRMKSGETIVQIVRRDDPDYTIDLRFWSRLSFEDRVALQLHEAAYAVSDLKDSEKIQSFETFWIQALQDHRKPGVQTILAHLSGWGLPPLRPVGSPLSASEQQGLPAGVEAIVDPHANQPYAGPFGYRNTEAVSETRGTRLAQVVITPWKSTDGVCGSLTEFHPETRQIAVHFMKSFQDQKSYFVDLSPEAMSALLVLRDRAQAAIAARTNRSEYPTARMGAPIVCFKKMAFRNLPSNHIQFVEFFNAVDENEQNEMIRVAGESTYVARTRLRIERLDAEIQDAADAGDNTRLDAKIREQAALRILLARHVPSEASVPQEQHYAFLNRVAFRFGIP